MGSAHGGPWQPKKPEDARLIGKPGEIKTIYAKDGTRIDTKIGTDGRASKERHYTTAPNPKYHTDPHDHEIDWPNGFPHWGPPINYQGDAPEFKQYRGNR